MFTDRVQILAQQTRQVPGQGKSAELNDACVQEIVPPKAGQSHRTVQVGQAEVAEQHCGFWDGA
jgi:hypothetical protein